MLGSCEFDLRLHRNSAFRRRCPDFAALICRLSTDLEGCCIKQWGPSSHIELPHSFAWVHVADEVQEALRCERPVDDEARITLNFCRISPVVVNAMRIESYCREAKVG